MFAPFLLNEMCFNPRSREGSDTALEDSAIDINGFNPRSREGSDKTTLVARKGGEMVSIHAPAKGATQKNYSS